MKHIEVSGFAEVLVFIKYGVSLVSFVGVDVGHPCLAVGRRQPAVARHANASECLLLSDVQKI